VSTAKPVGPILQFSGERDAPIRLDVAHRWSGLNYRMTAMWRRSVSCVCAGALMATAWQFFVVCAATGWVPHKVVAASAITLGITGWIWLWDELP
jgi:hypothetical protein